jgi:hypothetical protein
MRKGPGRPVERSQFYFTDDLGKVHFQLSSADTIYPDRPHARNRKRFEQFLNVKGLSLYRDKETGKVYIAIFRGLRPTSLELDENKCRRLYYTLGKLISLLYGDKDVGKEWEK